MRYISFNELAPEMVSAQDCYTIHGLKYLHKNEVLSEEKIESLRALGLRGLYIQDNLSADIMVDAYVSPVMRQQMMYAIEMVDLEQCEKYAVSLYKTFLAAGDSTLDYIDIRMEDEYDYAHAVQVAIVSAAIAVRMHVQYKDAINVILAALLHDVGKSQLPPEITKKKTRLSQEEYLTVKLHPSMSMRVIGQKGGVTEAVQQAIIQHHENEDGSGYPNGLSAADISLGAKIIHVADVFDALTSKSAFKEPYSLKEAKEYLTGAKGIMFDERVVDVLLNCVPNYAKGTGVILNNGKHAIVYRNQSISHELPFVITTDGEIINLAKNIDAPKINRAEETANFNVEDSEKQREIMVKGLKNYRVMAVDDQKTNLLLLREILDDYYELTLLKSGMQALKYLENNALPDLILMDINMPEMDGIETTREIMKRTHGMVPVIFVSSNNDAKTVLACRDLNCAGYIVRPYNAVYIKSEIKRILTGEP